MTRLPRYMGSAEREVYLKLLRSPNREWRRGQRALYENGGFTEELLQRLVLRKFVEETMDGDCPVYRATRKAPPQF
jgi:hypothetical protein